MKVNIEVVKVTSQDGVDVGYKIKSESTEINIFDEVILFSDQEKTQGFRTGPMVGGWGEKLIEKTVFKTG